jgi:hypothetical protein
MLPLRLLLRFHLRLVILLLVVNVGRKLGDLFWEIKVRKKNSTLSSPTIGWT